MLKNIVLASVFLMSAGPVLSDVPQCKNINLEALYDKIEDVVADAPSATPGKPGNLALDLFHKRVTKKERLCTLKINKAKKNGDPLSEQEEEIAGLFDLINEMF